VEGVAEETEDAGACETRKPLRNSDVSYQRKQIRIMSNRVSASEHAHRYGHLNKHVAAVAVALAWENLYEALIAVWSTSAKGDCQSKKHYTTVVTLIMWISTFAALSLCGCVYFCVEKLPSHRRAEQDLQNVHSAAQHRVPEFQVPEGNGLDNATTTAVAAAEWMPSVELQNAATMEHDSSGTTHIIAV